MHDPKQPQKMRSTDEILREMESMSKGINPPVEKESSISNKKNEESTFKSLLNFFVKITPDEEELKAQQNTISTDQNLSSETQQETTHTEFGNKRVGDLVIDKPKPKFNFQESNSEDLSVKPFENIYVEAGIDEVSCNIDELEKLITSPTIINQPTSVKVIAVNLALSAKGINIEVPIADAIRRDGALDAYQEMLSERVINIEKINSEKIQQITKEVEQYLKQKQDEMEKLRIEISEVNRQEIDFSLRREAEEKRMASLISPFLEGKTNPVTVGTTSENNI